MGVHQLNFLILMSDFLILYEKTLKLFLVILTHFPRITFYDNLVGFATLICLDFIFKSIDYDKWRATNWNIIFFHFFVLFVIFLMIILQKQLGEKSLKSKCDNYRVKNPAGTQIVHQKGNCWHFTTRAFRQRITLFIL